MGNGEMLAGVEEAVQGLGKHTLWCWRGLGEGLARMLVGRLKPWFRTRPRKGMVKRLGRLMPWFGTRPGDV
jgi:hypothetical protein